MTRDLQSWFLYLAQGKKKKDEKFSHVTLWMNKQPATEVLHLIATAI